MTRCSSLVPSLLLVVSLVLAAGFSGYYRTAHAMAQAGVETIVICGSNGAQTLTLDRDGQPIDPKPGQCPHCADCSLTPLVFLDMPALSGIHPVMRLHSTPPIATFPRVAKRVGPPSRGPPSPVRS